MAFPFRSSLLAALCVTSGAAALPAAAADAYPSRPIRLIVAYPTGGISDTVRAHSASGCRRRWAPRWWSRTRPARAAASASIPSPSCAGRLYAGLCRHQPADAQPACRPRQLRSAERRGAGDERDVLAGAGGGHLRLRRQGLCRRGRPGHRQTGLGALGNVGPGHGRPCGAGTDQAEVEGRYHADPVQGRRPADERRARRPVRGDEHQCQPGADPAYAGRPLRALAVGAPRRWRACPRCRRWPSWATPRPT